MLPFYTSLFAQKPKQPLRSIIFILSQMLYTKTIQLQYHTCPQPGGHPRLLSPSPLIPSQLLVGGGTGSQWEEVWTDPCIPMTWREGRKSSWRRAVQIFPDYDMTMGKNLRWTVQTRPFKDISMKVWLFEKATFYIIAPLNDSTVYYLCQTCHFEDVCVDMNA